MMCSFLFRTFYKVSASQIVAVTPVFVADQVEMFCKRFNRSQRLEPDKNIQNWFGRHSDYRRAADVTNIKQLLLPML